MKRLRLVLFDVDGTLIKINSSWRFLHQKLGTWERGSKYADQFFRGQISYEDWAKLDASLWKHTPLERVQKTIDNIPYADGACEVATLLKNEGLKVVLLSAGLSVVTDKVSREIGADDSYANELIVRDGFLTGEVKVNVSFENKDQRFVQYPSKVWRGFKRVCRRWRRRNHDTSLQFCGSWNSLQPT